MELNVSWHDWKMILHKAVNAADYIGISDERINDVPCFIGDFLAQKQETVNKGY